LEGEKLKGKIQFDLGWAKIEYEFENKEEFEYFFGRFFGEGLRELGEKMKKSIQLMQQT
jgi:hypothetical protein